jgi:hypothetical protein
VRDAFLVFLMVIAAGLLYAMVALLRWGFSDGADDEVSFWSVLGAVILLAAAGGLLLVVGHAVGVTLPNLGS